MPAHFFSLYPTFFINNKANINKVMIGKNNITTKTILPNMLNSPVIKFAPNVIGNKISNNKINHINIAYFIETLIILKFIRCILKATILSFYSHVHLNQHFQHCYSILFLFAHLQLFSKYKLYVSLSFEGKEQEDVIQPITISDIMIKHIFPYFFIFKTSNCKVTIIPNGKSSLYNMTFNCSLLFLGYHMFL